MRKNPGRKNMSEEGVGVLIMKGYPMEFKLKVINEYRNNPGATIETVFRRNGVYPRNYYKWIKEIEANNVKSAEEEIMELEDSYNKTKLKLVEKIESQTNKNEWEEEIFSANEIRAAVREINKREDKIIIDYDSSCGVITIMGRIEKLAVVVNGLKDILI